MSLASFPIELLDQIVSYLDPHSYLLATEASSTLYHLRTPTKVRAVLDELELTCNRVELAHDNRSSRHDTKIVYPCYGCFQAFPAEAFPFFGEQWMYDNNGNGNSRAPLELGGEWRADRRCNSCNEKEGGNRMRVLMQLLECQKDIEDSRRRFRERIDRILRLLRRP